MDCMVGSLSPFKPVRVSVHVRPCGGCFDVIENADYLMPISIAQNQSRRRWRSPCGPASRARFDVYVCAKLFYSTHAERIYLTHAKRFYSTRLFSKVFTYNILKYFSAQPGFPARQSFGQTSWNHSSCAVELVVDFFGVMLAFC